MGGKKKKKKSVSASTAATTLLSVSCSSSHAHIPVTPMRSRRTLLTAFQMASSTSPTRPCSLMSLVSALRVPPTVARNQARPSVVGSAQKQPSTSTLLAIATVLLCPLCSTASARLVRVRLPSWTALSRSRPLTSLARPSFRSQTS